MYATKVISIFAMALATLATASPQPLHDGEFTGHTLGKRGCSCDLGTQVCCYAVAQQYLCGPPKKDAC